jgi:hypothetical protein
LADGVTPSFDGTAFEGNCLLSVKKPVELCNPVNTTAVVPPRETTAVFTPSTAIGTRSLLCYKVTLATKAANAQSATAIGGLVGDKLDPKQSKHIKRGQKTANPVFTTPGSQFPGPVAVDTLKLSVACIPTDVIGVTVAP